MYLDLLECNEIYTDFVKNVIIGMDHNFLSTIEKQLQSEGRQKKKSLPSQKARKNKSKIKSMPQYIFWHFSIVYTESRSNLQYWVSWQTQKMVIHVQLEIVASWILDSPMLDELKYWKTSIMLLKLHSVTYSLVWTYIMCAAWTIFSS